MDKAEKQDALYDFERNGMSLERYQVLFFKRIENGAEERKFIIPVF